MNERKIISLIKVIYNMSAANDWVINKSSYI